MPNSLTIKIRCKITQYATSFMSIRLIRLFTKKFDHFQGKRYCYVTQSMQFEIGSLQNECMGPYVDLCDRTMYAADRINTSTQSVQTEIRFLVTISSKCAIYLHTVNLQSLVSLLYAIVSYESRFIYCKFSIPMRCTSLQAREEFDHVCLKRVSNLV